MRATVYVRDQDRVLRGELPVLTGEAVLRVNGVGSWLFDIDGTHEKAQRMVRGGGVVVEDDETGDPLLNGPTTQLLNSAAADGPVRTLAASGVTDEQHLADREVYPDPASAVTAQTALARYTATGFAETVIRNLVNLQAGPGALVDRRVPGLVLEAAGTVGATVFVSVRFKPHLAETIAGLAASGGVVWRIVQLGTDLVFQVDLPRDLTNRARFSREIANLGAYSYGLTAPTVTHVPVLGQGEGTLRTIRERTNVAAPATVWGRRIENSLDRRDTDTNEVLDQAGDEALLDGWPAASLEIDPTDLPRLRYGRDYRLGDKVTVELGDGVTITDIVRQVTLKWEPYGVVARPLIGPESARDMSEPKAVRRIANLSRRLGKLEADR